MEVGGKITSGVDLWLNTPQFPLEASGTSGMKAALNGVPSLSILDGWWVEGHIEGVTGWSIGELHRGTDVSTDNAGEAESLYHKLEHIILPLSTTTAPNFLKLCSTPSPSTVLSSTPSAWSSNTSPTPISVEARRISLNFVSTAAGFCTPPSPPLRPFPISRAPQSLSVS